MRGGFIDEVTEVFEYRISEAEDSIISLRLSSKRLQFILLMRNSNKFLVSTNSHPNSQGFFIPTK